MTNLSDLFPAGAGKQVSFTASGAISAAGKPVILNSAGTVTQVGESTGSETLGGPVDANDVTTKGYGVDICYDSGNDRLVAVWFRNSDVYPMAAVGTISGTTTTWGTPIVVESVAGDQAPAVDYDPDNGKVLMLYVRASDANARYSVGAVSGTTSTWGTSGEFYGNTTTDGLTLTYDTTHNYFLCTYHSGFGSDDCNVKIGSISGTTVTFGSNYAFTSGSNSRIMGIAYDVKEDAFAVLYRNTSNQLYGRVGTSTAAKVVTYGAETLIGTWNPYGMGSITYDATAQKCVAIFKNTSGYGAGAVVTVVGGSTRSFTDATETTFNSANIGSGDLSLHATYAGTNANTTTVVFIESSDNYPRFCNGTVSGTSISFNTVARLWTDNAANSRNNICPIASGKVAIIAQSNTTVGSMTDNYASVNVLQNVASTSNLTASNFVGIADAAILDTASGNVTIKGGIAATGLTSLTPGSDYYAQDDGSITTSSAGVKIGKAMSATAINLEYQS